MKPAKTIKEFVDKNNDDVRRIISFESKRNDEDYINDLTQQFYLNILKYKALERFDWTVPNPEAAFATWIYKTAENTVKSHYSHFMRKQGGYSHVVALENPRNSKAPSCIFNHLLPVEHTPAKRADSSVVNIHPDYNVGLVHDESSLYEMTDMLACFKEHVQADKCSSTRTKKMLLSYMAMAESGIRPSHIAKSFGVTPTYITSLRKVLRKMLVDFQRGYAEPVEVAP